MISFRHTSSRCPSGLRSFKRINVWETAASGVLHKRRRARGGDVIRPRESPSKSENLQRPTHSKNRAKKPTMDHPRTERKRKVLTSRHPNVPKPVDNDGDAPDLRRVALVKTKTVVDQNFNIDGNAFGVEGSIADETYIVEVTEEPSHHQAEKTEARRITINAKTATAVHKNDLMDIIGKVTFAPVDYKTASAASIINMDFREVNQSNFVHFFLTCIPASIRDLQLENDLSFPVSITYQLKVLIQKGVLQNIVLRACTRIDEQPVNPANILELLRSSYTELKNIVLIGKTGISQESVWNFVSSLITEERPLRFNTMSISVDEGCVEELDAEITRMASCLEPMPLSGMREREDEESLCSSGSNAMYFRNRDGLIAINFSDNVINIRCTH
ncbi:hypothetical protein L596_015427 [Steinernema carpocapsae]|uniref:Uncharacterized protein n=1 Tax=Steinernema carpocapsae TaxID=34508 RepID=A0A4U5NF53_STECR|nr:hypothetical protein L596_015427 [Steinernema carpocapsae]